jgi:hypothetical protein
MIRFPLFIICAFIVLCFNMWAAITKFIVNSCHPSLFPRHGIIRSCAVLYYSISFVWILILWQQTYTGLYIYNYIVLVTETGLLLLRYNNLASCVTLITFCINNKHWIKHDIVIGSQVLFHNGSLLHSRNSIHNSWLQFTTLLGI